MKVNKQSKVKVNKSGFKRSKFNWTHDVNTTFSWGEIQPTQCKMLIPGSKTTMQAQNLIRLAPMIAPTFGRVKYKTFNQFVSMADVFPNWDAMMAQEPKSTSYGTKVPQAVPTVKLGILSSWVLQGAHGTLYFSDSETNASKGLYSVIYRQGPNSQPPATWTTLFNGISGGNVFPQRDDPWNNASNNVLPNVTKTCDMLLNYFGSNYQSVFGSSTAGAVVLGCQQWDFCPVKRGYVPADNSDANQIKPNQREVTIEGADYVLEGVNGGKYFALALELSDFGKRIRKVLQGCGYQINFTSETRVSILPLLAQYKAYFDVFGLQLYQGWETTYCAKMIKYIENEFVENCDSMFMRTDKNSISQISNQKLGVAFMMNELANEWYTDDADYVSAHIDKLGVSPYAPTDGFIDVDGNGIRQGLNMNVIKSNTDNEGVRPAQKENALGSIGYGLDGVNGGHYTINQINHGELDSEMLKRLYRWTNRNTILGRRIAEILRAQGLGKYVDECKSYYIGSTDTMITISDVVSTAATDDAVLGEYGGKGLQYSSDQVLSFENDVYGYWITLATVVPAAGYTQGLDPTLTASRKMEFYNPDFDAMGMEATPKENIVCAAPIVGPANNDTNQETFGFIPRYSKFKVAQNLTNGDFNRHGLRNTYMPYTLDKQLNVNDYDLQAEKYTEVGSDTNPGQNLVLINKSRRVTNMPIAGNVWRMPTKFSWLGNFNRIFYNIGQVAQGNQYGEGFTDNTQAVGYQYYNNDNFLGHSIYEVNSYAPMKPIEDSYGLDEDDSMRAGAEFTSKA